MIRSMTAYGRGECEVEGVRVIAEIRSFNNRHRDIILRAPKAFQTIEEELRAIISSRIKRGRVEVSIKLEGNGEEPSYKLELNESLAKSYFGIFKQIKDLFGLKEKVPVTSILNMKDVVLYKSEEQNIDWIKPGIKDALEKSLDSHEEMRVREGKVMEEDFLKRIQKLEQYALEIKRRVPDIVKEYGNRLKDRVQAMLGEFEVDENRIAQEVAFLAEKSDITEEIVRTGSHLKQFRDYLSIDDAMGRRLDFLIQEINREVNTTSAKASDSVVSKIVVEMKAELEKLREQVQNVE